MKLGLTKKQLQARRHVLGGTDAAAILGLSRSRNAWDVYAEKVGEALPAGEQSEGATWGLMLEPVILAEYRRRTGVDARKPRQLIRHPIRTWQAGHLDGVGPDRLLEIKTRRWSRGWGEAGTDDIPAEVRAQVEHYLDVTGLPRADVAVLFMGQELRIYTIEADPRALADLSDEEGEWWHEHVVLGVPPAFDGSPQATAYQRRRWPVDDGSELVALPQQYPLLEDYKLARRKAAVWATQEKRLQQAIMEAMGEATKLLAPGLKVTWTQVADSHRINWQAYAETLLKMLPEDRLEEAATLKGIYTSITPGTRRFTARVVDPQLEGGTS